MKNFFNSKFKTTFLASKNYHNSGLEDTNLSLDIKTGLTAGEIRHTVYVGQQNPEMTTSSFLIAIMICVSCLVVQEIAAGK